MNETAITSAARFAARDIEIAAELGSPENKAIRRARYWESFPESYRPEQVEAGRDLIREIGRGEMSAETIARVLALPEW